MKIEKLKIDSKGRIVLPYAFRETLGMREGDLVFASLDDAKTSLIISPFGEKDVYQLDIEMSDRPGTFAALLKVFSEAKVDLVAVEAHSVVRTKSAHSRVVCKLKPKSIPGLLSKLKKNGALRVAYRRV